MSETAGDIMTKNIITVRDDTSLNNLVGIFTENKISCAPVINKKKQLIGIVTKSDILSYFLEIDLNISIKYHLKDILESKLEDIDLEIPPETDFKVKNIMTANPITVNEKTSIKSLANIMLDNNIHRLIVKKGKTTVGIISTRNLISHVAGIDKNE
ncbi:CBS domain-containing protein [Candidatus Latescibacterota bacterium]